MFYQFNKKDGMLRKLYREEEVGSSKLYQKEAIIVIFYDIA